MHEMYLYVLTWAVKAIILTSLHLFSQTQFSSKTFTDQLEAHKIVKIMCYLIISPEGRVSVV